MRNTRNKFISFDLDGTLIELDFSLTIWRKAIPNLVARQKGIPVDKASEWVFLQYETVGERALEWYDLAYWYERFEIEETWRETLRRHRSLIRPFPEVTEVLNTLAKHYRLLILSNASRPFVQAEMEEGGLEGLFEHAISATSDFGLVKKNREFYARVCQMLGARPSEVVHVGDHWEFDYQAASRAGLAAYFLDRSGRNNDPGVVHDLKAFARGVLNESNAPWSTLSV